MVDKYASFAALAAREIEGVHYRIRVAARPSPIAVIAPHGGWIEPGASEAAIAMRESFLLLLRRRSPTCRPRSIKGDQDRR